MIKTSKLNYFDKQGQKVFTYFYIDDPLFYDDDSNGCDNWVQAHIPLKSDESPKSAFYHMLQTQEIFTARQLRKFRQQDTEELPIITITDQTKSENEQSFQKAILMTKRSFGKSVDIYLKRHLAVRERA